jgi:hypothetical protein
MDILDKKTDKELLQSTLAEVAKANNEIRCAQNDINKAQSRLKFVVMICNNLIDRAKD